MCDHFSSICRAYLELRRIVSVRPLFTAETAGELACSRILSGIDCCNSLLAGIILDMQHPAARLIFRNIQQTNKQTNKRTSKNKHHDYVTPSPEETPLASYCRTNSLHWQFINSFRYFVGTLPHYFSCKHQALVYDTLPLKKVPESGALGMPLLLSVPVLSLQICLCFL